MNSAILDVLHSASELVASRDFAARVQTSDELARALAPLLLPPKLTAANCFPNPPPQDQALERDRRVGREGGLVERPLY